ncbi:hypothetical protein C8Q80DRAFT_1124751 [Daedaleopsis nitida]|nr:hypothetical protein C8Q80DRAFT_1124751 [Daedaleopsis nitida]
MPSAAVALPSAAVVVPSAANVMPSAAVALPSAAVAMPSAAVAVASAAVNVNEARAAEVCGFPVVPLYRAASDSLTDRIWTTDATEIEAALASGKYVREAVIAAVYSNTTGPNVPNAVPLYRLYSAGKMDHFITTSWDEVESAVNTNGYSYQGITAYAYPGPEAGCGTVPLYRQYNPQIEDHFYSTTKPSDNVTAENGYFYEGITAYVFPPQ